VARRFAKIKWAFFYKGDIMKYALCIIVLFMLSCKGEATRFEEKNNAIFRITPEPRKHYYLSTSHIGQITDTRTGVSYLVLVTSDGVAITPIIDKNGLPAIFH